MPLTIGSVTIPTRSVPMAERLLWCNARPGASPVDLVRLDFAAAALATGFSAPGGAPLADMRELGDIFAADLARRTPAACDGERWLACQGMATELLIQTWGAPRAAEVESVADFSNPMAGGGPSSAVSSPTAGEAMPSSG